MRLRSSLFSLTLLAVSFILSQPVLHAKIVFEQSQLKLKAKPGQEKLEVVFKFVNEGPDPVTVTKVKPSCGCTIANIKEERTYESGEQGEIRADFTVGNRRGSKDVSISVETADHVNYRLGFSVHIPTVLEIKPKVLVWKSSELDQLRTTEVILHVKEGYTLKEPESFPDGVSYTVEENEKGVFSYSFRMSPTMEKGVHKMPFVALADTGSALSEQLFLMVR